MWCLVESQSGKGGFLDMMRLSNRKKPALTDFRLLLKVCVRSPPVCCCCCCCCCGKKLYLGVRLLDGALSMKE